MSKDKTLKRPKKGSVVLLRDLTPRKKVAGGSGKLLFGERQEPAADPPKPSKRGRFLSPNLRQEAAMATKKPKSEASKASSHVEPSAGEASHHRPGVVHVSPVPPWVTGAFLPAPGSEATSDVSA
jgi:hypothetical protein